MTEKGSANKLVTGADSIYLAKSMEESAPWKKLVEGILFDGSRVNRSQQVQPGFALHPEKWSRILRTEAERAGRSNYQPPSKPYCKLCS